MKNVKLLCLILLIVACLGSLAGCGKYVPYDYDVSKYITLGEYKGLSAEYENIDVTDADLQQAINSQLRENGYGEPEQVTEGKILYGDIVTMDYSGAINGKNDAALSATELELEIGTDTFLEDFELGLVGQNIGETFTMEIPFPADYVKIDYAGKNVTYAVTVRSVDRMVYPQLTDEMVVDISSYATVEEYTKAKKEELAQTFLQQADEAREQALWDQVVANCNVESYPEDAIEYITETYRSQFEEEAALAGLEMKEYLEQNNLTWDEINAYILNNAQIKCKDEMVMYAIARAEDLRASEDEIAALAKSYADTYGYKNVKDLYKNHSKELVEQALLYQKVKDFVVENAAE